MKYITYGEESLEEVLKYLEDNDQTSKTLENVSTAHSEDFKFSDRYVMKKVGTGEFVLYSTILEKKNPTHAKFSTFFPEVVSLVYDEKEDEKYLAMKNYVVSSTVSQIEFKIGYFNFLPTHNEAKQQSKFRSAFLLGSVDDGFRVCMYSRKDLKGETVESKKIEKVEGVKQVISPNSFDHLLYLREEEEHKREVMVKAIDFFEKRIGDLLDIFRNHINELGFMITAASLVFLLDLDKEFFDVKFIDFGCATPCSNMEIWPSEQADALQSLLLRLKESKAKFETSQSTGNHQAQTEETISE